MASEIKVDTIVNSSGDEDSGFDLSTNDVVKVKTANNERLRIDASGNLLVGKTSASGSTVGGEIRSDGRVLAVVDDNFAGFFARKSADGEIVRFLKDTTTVGQINSKDGDLTVGTGDTGLRFIDGSEAISPHNLSTNSGRDNAIDLGTSGARFNNLYLSGGVYVGGTGSANKFSDYEEGTWTPTLIDGAGSSRTVSGADGRYTKIGRTVHIEFTLSKNETGGSGGNLNIGNLPFTSNNSGSPFYINGGMWADEGGPSTNQGDSVGIIYLPKNVTYLLGLKTTNNAQQADHRYFRYEQITNSRGVSGAFTYKTDS